MSKVPLPNAVLLALMDWLDSFVLVEPKIMTNLNSVRLAAALTLYSVALLSAAQITVGPMPPIAICGSPTLSVGYTVTTPFNTGNVFTVELSDAAGSFASPTVIGSVVAAGSSTVQCTFPAGLIGGSGIAIRVVASDPPELGVAYPLPFTTIGPANAGLDDFFTFCSSDAPIIMINYVGGDPDVGGTWTTPAGAVHSGFFNAAVDLAGCYSYTVQGNAPCPADVSQHCITVVQAANAGISSTDTVCQSGPAFALISALDGTPQNGGAWSFGGAPHSPVFVPGVDIAGCYSYTVQGNAPCSSAVATVCIFVVEPIDLGPNTTLTFCSIGDPVDLNALYPPGGSWTSPAGPHNGIFIPGVDPIGMYTYTLVGDAPCPAGMVSLFLTAIIGPDAGISSSTTLCSDSAPFTLFAQLGGSPQLGGIWTDPVGQPANGIFVPGTSAPGCYTYTILGSAPCQSATATVCVQVVQAPNAGSDTIIVVCSSGPPENLFLILAGNPQIGGAWSGPSSIIDGFFNPMNMSSGVYCYILSGAGCPNAEACVTVIKNLAPNAGTDTSATLCSNAAPSTLSDYLGTFAQPTGAWTDPNGDPHSGIFVPAISQEGCYQYVVFGNTPCINDTAMVCVALDPCLSIDPIAESDATGGLRILSGWNSGRLIVGLPREHGPLATLEVVDAIGRVLILQRLGTSDGSRSITIDLSAQPPGIYTVVLWDSDRRHTLQIHKN